MSQLENRHISFVNAGQTFFVPAYSRVLETGEFIKIRFSLERNLAASDIVFVDVDNEDGYIRMVTSRGNDFTSGPLYDQVLNWYQMITGR